jgi:outer membrane protein
MMPQVTANMSYNLTGSENSASFFTEQNNRGFNYGLTARVPLFDGFNRRRAVQNSRIDEKIAELELEWSELEVESMLLQAYTDYANALELIEIEEQNILVAQENASIAIDRFQLGTYTPVELREAQQALLNTENRLVSAKYAAKASETRLLLISGRLKIITVNSEQ